VGQVILDLDLGFSGLNLDLIVAEPAATASFKNPESQVTGDQHRKRRARSER
jgi:hypothetical protein